VLKAQAPVLKVKLPELLELYHVPEPAPPEKIPSQITAVQVGWPAGRKLVITKSELPIVELCNPRTNNGAPHRLPS
jgi:hypothetical protein